MGWDEWRDEYKKAMLEWKERMRGAMEEWRRKMKETAKKGMVMPPVPPIPPMPPLHIMSTSRSNVVASRIGDEELREIDTLVEAGVFNTRSEAVAYLVSEGIKARKDVFSKVSSALEDIRRIRKESEDYITKLRKDIGFEEVEASKAAAENRICPKCKREISQESKFCQNCGEKLE